MLPCLLDKVDISDSGSLVIEEQDPSPLSLSSISSCFRFLFHEGMVRLFTYTLVYIRIIDLKKNQLSRTPTRLLNIKLFLPGGQEANARLLPLEFCLLLNKSSDYFKMCNYFQLLSCEKIHGNLFLYTLLGVHVFKEGAFKPPNILPFNLYRSNEMFICLAKPRPRIMEPPAIPPIPIHVTGSLGSSFKLLAMFRAGRGIRIQF